MTTEFRKIQWIVGIKDNTRTAFAGLKNKLLNITTSAGALGLKAGNAFLKVSDGADRLSNRLNHLKGQFDNVNTTDLGAAGIQLDQLKDAVDLVTGAVDGIRQTFNDSFKVAVQSVFIAFVSGLGDSGDGLKSLESGIATTKEFIIEGFRAAAVAVARFIEFISLAKISVTSLGKLILLDLVKKPFEGLSMLAEKAKNLTFLPEGIREQAGEFKIFADSMLGFYDSLIDDIKTKTQTNLVPEVERIFDALRGGIGQDTGDGATGSGISDNVRGPVQAREPGQDGRPLPGETINLGSFNMVEEIVLTKEGLDGLKESTDKVTECVEKGENRWKGFGETLQAVGGIFGTVADNFVSKGTAAFKFFKALQIGLGAAAGISAQLQALAAVDAPTVFQKVAAYARIGGIVAKALGALKSVNIGSATTAPSSGGGSLPTAPGSGQLNGGGPGSALGFTQPQGNTTIIVEGGDEFEFDRLRRLADALNQSGISQRLDVVRRS